MVIGELVPTAVVEKVRAFVVGPGVGVSGPVVDGVLPPAGAGEGVLAPPGVVGKKPAWVDVVTSGLVPSREIDGVLASVVAPVVGLAGSVVDGLLSPPPAVESVVASPVPIGEELA